MFRRSVLGITHRGAIPPLILHAEGQQLRAQYRYHDLAIEYVEPGVHRLLDSIPVPLDARDGHQLLVRSGFGLPWDGDLLVKGSPVFTCKALPRDQPIRIGKTDTHVVLRTGPWTTFHEIQKESRFPRVEEVLPENDAV